VRQTQNQHCHGEPDAGGDLFAVRPGLQDCYQYGSYVLEHRDHWNLSESERERERGVRAGERGRGRKREGERERGREGGREGGRERVYMYTDLEQLDYLQPA